MLVKKRDGRMVEYDGQKIINAINKANAEVTVENRISYDKILEILHEIENTMKDNLTVEGIQDFIETKLMENEKYILAKKYVIYRYTRSLVRKANTTDDSILSLISNKNKEVGEENSNKNAAVASTQRDLIAGEVSKDLSRRMLLPEKLRKAHDDGVLHFHDMDYFYNLYLIVAL